MSDDPENDPNVVIAFSRDRVECGEVCVQGALAAKVAAGPIRLLQGKKFLFGLLHIEEEDRAKAIRGRGYASCSAFVFDVASNWTHLHKGDNDRITLATQHTKGFNAIVLHWQDNKFWSVVTALPFRRPKEPLIFTKARANGSEPRSMLAAQPRFETLTLPKPKGS